MNISDYMPFLDGIKPHIIDGRKIFSCDGKFYCDEKTFDSVVSWQKANQKRIYFLREKIICLQKLLEIPELYQEVYYARKSEFISLLRKI